MKEPWEHPDWYDLHDTTWTVGVYRFRDRVVLRGERRLSEAGASSSGPGD